MQLAIQERQENPGSELVIIEKDVPEMSSPGPNVTLKKGVGRGGGRAGAPQAAVKPRGESLRQQRLTASTEGPLRLGRTQTVKMCPY